MRQNASTKCNEKIFIDDMSMSCVFYAHDMANKRNTPEGADKAKERVNITISEDTARKGEELRQAEHRNSFSNVVEWLIGSAWERQFGTAPKEEEKKPANPEHREAA